MFTRDELNNILRHVNLFHTSLISYQRHKAVEFITHKLREKMPNIHLDEIIKLIHDFNPEIDLNKIFKHEEFITNKNIPAPRKNPETTEELISRMRTFSNTMSDKTSVPYKPTYFTSQSIFREREKEKNPERYYDKRYDDFPDRTESLKKEIRSELIINKDFYTNETPTSLLLQGVRDIHEHIQKPMEKDSVLIETEWMTDPEKECFNTLTEHDKNTVCVSYKEMKNSDTTNAYPIRLQVLMSKIPETKKSEIFKKLENIIPGIGESSKYSGWVNSLISIPFGTYTKMPCKSDKPDDVLKFLNDSRQIFDNEVYGHPNVKNEFTSILGSWIKLGESHSQGNVIGITGPIGVGKTTLIKDGLAKALNRPFYFISLGGSSYSSFLNGHGYTYEGSTYGEIARGLIESKCMDPVFYFDELDKVSTDARGEEIIHTLIHLTDPAQNTCFNDRYFTGTPLDISKALFVFSYNNKEKVNPILRDRIHEICLDDFTHKEKTEIAALHVIPRICKAMGVHQNKLFTLHNETLEHLVELCNHSTGLRLLKTILIQLIRIINVASLTNSKLILNLDKKFFNGKPPFLISKNMISQLFEIHQKGQHTHNTLDFMYM
jgi:ATP-dependent Lon protease